MHLTYKKHFKDKMELIHDYSVPQCVYKNRKSLSKGKVLDKEVPFLTVDMIIMMSSNLIQC